MSSGAVESVPTGRWISRTAADTLKLGERVGASLTGGEIILLTGPLGAGKTVFAKGIAGALSIDTDEVTSPSFTLVNRYDEGRLTLYHIDLYRLGDGPTAAHAVDLDELLTDMSAVFVIEWAERMGRYPLPSAILKVSISGDGDAPREIVVSSRR